MAGHSSLGGPWRPDDDENVSEGLGQSCVEEAEDVPDVDRYRREMDRLEQRLAAHHQTDDETMRMSADDLDATEARMVELKSRSVAAGVKDEVCGACGVILTSRSYCPTCGSTPGGTRWCLGELQKHPQKTQRSVTHARERMFEWISPQDPALCLAHAARAQEDI